MVDENPQNAALKKAFEKKRREISLDRVRAARTHEPAPQEPAPIHAARLQPIASAPAKPKEYDNTPAGKYEALVDFLTQQKDAGILTVEQLETIMAKATPEGDNQPPSPAYYLKAARDMVNEAKAIRPDIDIRINRFVKAGPIASV